MILFSAIPSHKRMMQETIAQFMLVEPPTDPNSDFFSQKFLHQHDPTRSHPSSTHPKVFGKSDTLLEIQICIWPCIEEYVFWLRELQYPKIPRYTDNWYYICFFFLFYVLLIYIFIFVLMCVCIFVLVYIYISNVPVYH